MKRARRRRVLRLLIALGGAVAVPACAGQNFNPATAERLIRAGCTAFGCDCPTPAPTGESSPLVTPTPEPSPEPTPVPAGIRTGFVETTL